MKSKFLLGFAFLGLSLLSAKSYEISVDAVSKAGDAQLQPGMYKVSIAGNRVKFTNQDSGKSVETNAVVDTAGAKSKFDSTAVESENGQNGTTIREIDLGGTTTKVKFQ